MPQLFNLSGGWGEGFRTLNSTISVSAPSSGGLVPIRSPLTSLSRPLPHHHHSIQGYFWLASSNAIVYKESLEGLFVVIINP
jgi:hypothetical protein